jgi:hypothetical protein
MSLAEVTEHVARVREDLQAKKADLDHTLLYDPATGMQMRYQIDCLEPRLAELERTCRRMTKEAEARAALTV